MVFESLKELEKLTELITRRNEEKKKNKILQGSLAAMRVYIEKMKEISSDWLMIINDVEKRWNTTDGPVPIKSSFPASGDHNYHWLTMPILPPFPPPLPPPLLPPPPPPPPPPTPLKNKKKKTKRKGRRRRRKE